MSNLSTRIDQLSPAKRALLALQAKARLDPAERPRAEAIAIIGMGCRFPAGADTPEAFWELLQSGVDAITEVPRTRWDADEFYDPRPGVAGKANSRHGGFLNEVETFDAQFFSISPREAIRVDPQQRLLLEVSWEALENAGQASERLAGSQTGVFVGMSTGDYAALLVAAGLDHIDGFFGPGNAPSIAAGRLAYTLGLQGPAMVVDTACSSSLSAVHLALQSLRSGECSMALAGGVNLMLYPVSTIVASQLRLMAADGRCKTFDASADGYVRGEGCGIVVLKRLSDAIADGDPILAVIRGSAINQDGRSAGLTAPNGPAQEAVIRRALANAAVEPSMISYIEAHGTGTALGDPMEVQALAAVLGNKQPPEQPLAIGSVKTNLGHLEAAAGVAGLIKVVLSLQHRQIPPHLHFKKVNPHISLEAIPAVVPTALMPWAPRDGRRIAGISAFGFSGTNVHLIVEEAPTREPVEAEIDLPAHLLALSAKREETLKVLARRYADHFAANPSASLGDACFTANVGRSHFEHRLAVVAASVDEARDKLAAFAAGARSTGRAADAAGTKSRRVAFLFTGQGSQYTGMGRRLYETQPTFRKALERCDELLRPLLERPLLEVLYPPPGVDSPLDDTAYTQPALFALEYALAELWRSFGVEPSAVLGHSVGEYVAACVAGVFSLEDGLKLIALRGRLMQALPRDGAMAVVFADAADVAPALGTHPCGRVEIAAVNGPGNTVLSGDRTALGAALDLLADAGFVTRRLNVSHAFHSALMDPMLDAFERAAGSLSLSAARIPLISNLTGRMLDPGYIPDATYWRRHVRETVQFAAGMRALIEGGHDLFVELGPSPTLVDLGEKSFPAGTATWLPCMKKDGNDWQILLDSVSALYTGGVNIDWMGFDRDYRRSRVRLPTYPFHRRRYWIDAPGTNGAAKSNAGFPSTEPRQDSSPDIDMNAFVDVLDSAHGQLAHRTVETASTFGRGAPEDISVNAFVDVLP